MVHRHHTMESMDSRSWPRRALLCLLVAPRVGSGAPVSPIAATFDRCVNRSAPNCRLPSCLSSCTHTGPFSHSLSTRHGSPYSGKKCC
ncbi:hypothetical protein EDB86DRAFT_2969481 [Lactarius hatsudake]|nr:hypothetical protein EDB86DRAFT_2969481 [Lactarius hatsudake]